MKGKKLINFKRPKRQLEQNKLSLSHNTKNSSVILDLNKSLNNLINIDEDCLKNVSRIDKKPLPMIISRGEQNSDIRAALNQDQKSRRLFSNRVSQNLKRKFKSKRASHQKINNSLGSLVQKEIALPRNKEGQDKSPVIRYPGLTKNIQGISQNKNVFTSSQNKRNLQDEYSVTQISLQDLVGERSSSGEGVRKPIHNFISHNRNPMLEAYSKIDLKKFYLGKHRDPKLRNNRTTSYESLNVKEPKKPKFQGFQKFYQNLKKYSTLSSEPLISGCCSPKSDNISLDQGSNNFARFIPKDSHEDLQKWNFELATKVKLISRKEILKNSDEVSKVDKQTRKYRRSLGKLKSSKEREVIRYHKHNKKDKEFFVETEDSKLTSQGIITPAQSTPTSKFEEMMPVYPPREIIIRTEGENKVKDVRKSCEPDKNFNPKFSSDYGLVLNTKYGISNSRIGKIDDREPVLNESPLKRWKRRAKRGSHGRIQLLSNVFLS
ncbi:unnamed protein product [Moneuplotes crassus]|uniref:Uncharacterized protein n=1 Tax=Euplotes crassus TaxID=5936 RepID=A0AAD1UGY5_EUPCR|nr:unnamed protein product [Moneuplotes crassus]